MLAAFLVSAHVSCTSLSRKPWLARAVATIARTVARAIFRTGIVDHAANASPTWLTVTDSRTHNIGKARAVPTAFVWTRCLAGRP